MPSREERHSRSRWEWGREPGRADQVRDAATRDAAASAPEPLPSKLPAKKDTRSWCKGKVGRLHKPEMVVKASYWTRKCGWRKTGKWVLTQPLPPLPKGVPVPRNRLRGKREWVETGQSWNCLHEYRCQECGKFLGPIATRCPDMPAGEQQS